MSSCSYFQLSVTVCEAGCFSSHFPLPCSPRVGPWLVPSVNKHHTLGTAGLCLQSGYQGECAASIV